MSRQPTAPPPDPDRTGNAGWVRFSDYRLHLGRGELERSGATVHLPPQATRLLVLLVSRAGELVDRDEIRRHIWGDSFVDFEHGLHNAVRQIRTVFGETPVETKFVETVPRRGYRFVAPCEADPQLHAAGRTPRTLRRRTLAVALIGAAIISMAIALARNATRAHEPPQHSKARHLLAQGRPESAELAIPLFEEAIRREPSFAGSHAGLATAILRAPNPRLRLERARSAIQSARELEPLHAEANARAAEVAFYFDWQIPQALDTLNLAVAASPDDPTVLMARAHVLSALARHDEALADGERALAIDPVSATVRGDLGLLDYWARRYAEAAAMWQELLQLDPQDAFAQAGRAEALVAMGRVDEARPLLLEVLRREGAAAEALGRLAVAGSPGVESLFLAQRLELLRQRVERGDAVRPEALAYVLARRGERQEAMLWLERAYQERTPALVFLGVDRDVDSLRSLPEFQHLLRRIGIP